MSSKHIYTALFPAKGFHLAVLRIQAGPTYTCLRFMRAILLAQGMLAFSTHFLHGKGKFPVRSQPVRKEVSPRTYERKQRISFTILKQIVPFGFIKTLGHDTGERSWLEQQYFLPVPLHPCAVSLFRRHQLQVFLSLARQLGS